MYKILFLSLVLTGVVFTATPAMAQSTATETPEAATGTIEEDINLQDFLDSQKPKASPYGKPVAVVLIAAAIVGLYAIEKRSS